MEPATTNNFFESQKQSKNNFIFRKFPALTYLIFAINFCASFCTVLHFLQMIIALFSVKFLFDFFLNQLVFIYCNKNKLILREHAHSFFNKILVQTVRLNRKRVSRIFRPNHTVFFQFFALFFSKKSPIPIN